MDRAERAVGHVGTADLSEVAAPRRLRALEDGDDVFGLHIVATPGHTAGHVAVFDTGSRVLVAGDALTNTDGLAGSNPQFTEAEAAAVRPVSRLPDLQPRTILVGHGDPILNGASDALHGLASSLS
jgi:glyoxylase-like metal-dependent hydrolase (beta-lactamase superfamily II)